MYDQGTPFIDHRSKEEKNMWKEVGIYVMCVCVCCGMVRIVYACHALLHGMILCDACV